LIPEDDTKLQDNEPRESTGVPEPQHTREPNELIKRTESPVDTGTHHRSESPATATTDTNKQVSSGTLTERLNDQQREYEQQHEQQE
jgi:hypothetical protein